MNQLTLIPEPPPKPMGDQLRRVYEYMSDGQEASLRVIACECNCLETSASARLRDLRKRGYTVHRREVRKGLWLYRVEA